MTQPLYKLMVPDEIVLLVRSLHPKLKVKIKAALVAIVSDPYVGKALRDELEGLKSYRVGSFRIVYRMAENKVIDIVAIGPRKYIYAETYRLVKREQDK